MAFRRAPAFGKPLSAPKQPVKNYAIWLLSRREFSAAELKERLLQRGYSLEDAEEALAFVQAHRFQDDARYAHTKSVSDSRRLGNRQIKFRLADKGIDPELIAQEIDALTPEEDRAIAAISRYEGQPITETLKAKIWRFMAYRGFGGTAIKAAIRHLQTMNCSGND
jgi:regulatory protein